MTDLLLTTDLSNATKQQLKNLVKAIRSSWGKVIDLRKADAVALKQYLEDYLTAQATEPEVDAVAPEAEVTLTENAEVEIVTHTFTDDFEGIEQRIMQPEVPESFNNVASRTIDILLQFGIGYGDIVNREWITGILKDCSWRPSLPSGVTEKLILSDPIYYGLAGISHDSIALYERLVKSPEEFGNIPEEAKQGADFYRTIGSMFGADKIAQISAYHSIRDNLNYLQERLGISSLEPRSYAIRDKFFTTQDYNDQMALLDSDRRVLKSEAQRISEYFQLLTTDYQLFRQMDDERLDPLPHHG
jgi:hypothetical protein